MPHEHPSTGLCQFFIYKALGLLSPRAPRVVPADGNRRPCNTQETDATGGEQQKCNRLVGNSKTKINVVLFPPRVKCIICRSPGPFFHLCLFPASDNYRHISPSAEQEPLETQQPSGEHRAQIFPLLSLSSELTNK